MKKNKKTVFQARSKENGIVFYSNKIPILCYETLRDEDGKISSRVAISLLSEINDCAGMFVDSKDWNIEKEVRIIRNVLLILAITFTFITLNCSSIVAVLYFSFYALENLMLLIHLSSEMKFGKSKKIARFHSAEHKVINAYEKNQRIPTMDEIKKSSRISKECGSRLIIDPTAKFVIASLVLFIGQFVSIKVYVILIIAMITMFLISRKFAIFGPLQVLVTNKATDDELEVALEGIKYFEKMENKIEEIELSDCMAMHKVFLNIGLEDETK